MAIKLETPPPQAPPERLSLHEQEAAVDRTIAAMEQRAAERDDERVVLQGLRGWQLDLQARKRAVAAQKADATRAHEVREEIRLLDHIRDEKRKGMEELDRSVAWKNGVLQKANAAAAQALGAVKGLEARCADLRAEADRLEARNRELAEMAGKLETLAKAPAGRT